MHKTIQLIVVICTISCILIGCAPKLIYVDFGGTGLFCECDYVGKDTFYYCTQEKCAIFKDTPIEPEPEPKKKEKRGKNIIYDMGTTGRI